MNSGTGESGNSGANLWNDEMDSGDDGRLSTSGYLVDVTTNSHSESELSGDEDLCVVHVVAYSTRDDGNSGIGESGDSDRFSL